MAQISSIERKLSDEERQKLNKLIGRGGSTLQELMDFCEESFGVTISQTAMHRWREHFKADAQAMRESRMVIEALGKELGESETLSAQGRLLVEMVRHLAADMLRKARDEGDGLSPKDIAMLGKGFAELARALRFDQDFEEKIRKQVEESIKKEVADAVDAVVVGEKGLSSDTIEKIKTTILGVRPDEGA